LEANEGDAEQIKPVRDALAQLQIAYAREIGAVQEAPEEGQEAQKPPSKPSGGLWVPPGSAG
jgi:hypothetical protein